MKKLLVLSAALLALSACSKGSDQAPDGPPKGGPPPVPQPIPLADRPGATGGEKLYLEHCIMCHEPNGMGTGLLARRAEVSLLEARSDLTADYVIQAARQGIGNMPAIPRGEVSDAQLKQIADYLAAGPHAATAKGETK